MKRTMLAPTFAALLALPACDAENDELDRELGIADRDGEAEDESETFEAPEALKGEGEPGDTHSLRLRFEGPCSDVSGRFGEVVLWIDGDGGVQGFVADQSYPGQSLPIEGGVAWNGSFEAVESAPFGECTWTGLVDSANDIAYGGWDCGQGCAGDWWN